MCRWSIWSRTEVEEGRERNIFCFHFQPGGSCGRHSRDGCSSAGHIPGCLRRPWLSRESRSSTGFTPKDQVQASGSRVCFFFIIFFTPRLLYLLVCLGEKVQLSWMCARPRSKGKDRCFACAVVLMGEQTSNNQFSSKVNNFYASDRKDEKHTSF